MTAREAIDKAYAHFKEIGLNENEFTHAPIMEMALLYMMESLIQVVSSLSMNSISSTPGE